MRPRPRLIERGATGIVCASDPIALGAIRAVRRAGVGIPRRLRHRLRRLGVHELHRPARSTTVRQPLEAIGRAAWRCRIGQIEGRTVTAEESSFFEPEIVARGSTAAAPVDARVLA